MSQKDTIAATPSLSGLDGSQEDVHHAVDSRFFSDQVLPLLTEAIKEKNCWVFQHFTLDEHAIIPLVILTPRRIILVTQWYPHEGEIIGNEKGQWFVLVSDDEIIELNENPFQQAEHVRARFIQVLLQHEKDTTSPDLTPLLQFIHASVIFPKNAKYNNRQLQEHSRQWFSVMTPNVLKKEILRDASNSTNTNTDVESMSRSMVDNRFFEDIKRFLKTGSSPLRKCADVVTSLNMQKTPAPISQLKTEVRWFCDYCPSSCKGGRLRQWRLEELSLGLEALNAHYLILEYHCALKGDFFLEDVICQLRSFFYHVARKYGMHLDEKQRKALSQKLLLLKKKLAYQKESKNH